MHSHKNLVEKWQDFNITRESCRQKKRGGWKIVKGLDLEENSHEGHGFDNLDFCFTSAYA